jgi:hypothetical protein
MIQLTTLNTDGKQNFIIQLENREIVSFSIEFVDNQQSWYYSLTYNNKTINGRKLAISENTLRQWKNLFPFGIMVKSTDGGEPFFQDDFIKERITIFILNESEVLEIENLYYNI